jgi:hypothetical protein
VANIYDLASRVRLELGDQPKQFSLTFTGDGQTSDFPLAIHPIDPYTLEVYVNSNPVAVTTGYSLEADIGVVHFVTAPPAGSAILIRGLVYRYFTDDDICQFVNTAVTQHTYNRTNGLGSQMTVALIPPVEEYPIAILATIEALWALATDASFDINIQAPDGVSIPRSDRYRQLTQTIQNRWDQYKQLCAALNIGLWRIEMGTLRRVSRTTNKLIPVYMAQEIDDSRRPERVYIQNDLLGHIPFPSYVEVQDIILYQGDSYREEVDFPFDITGLEWKAQIRTYPNAPSLYGTFDIAVTYVSETLSKITLSLDKKATEYLPPRAFWDLQATATDDSGYENTYLRGQVFTTQEVTLD